jgi:hypothetical protein
MAFEGLKRPLVSGEETLHIRFQAPSVDKSCTIRVRWEKDPRSPSGVAHSSSRYSVLKTWCMSQEYCD